MIQITKEIEQNIILHAGEDAPIEACGYLAGKDNLILKYYRMQNVDQSPVHYSLDPQEQLKVIKNARSCGMQILAVYHSHPQTPARMSAEDIRLANDPHIIYFIISLTESPVVKAFRLDDNQVSEVKIEVVE